MYKEFTGVNYTNRLITKTRDNTMKITIEIERDEELEKIGKVLKGESITVVKTNRGKEEILENIFKKYNVKLPANYKFDREKIHAR